VKAVWAGHDIEAKAVSVSAAAAPVGYAQLFMGAWLRSSADDATRRQARLAQSRAPDADLPDPAPGAQPGPQSVTAVRSTQREAGPWPVTAAAQYAKAPVRYYAVPVAVDDDGGSFAVTGPPAVVAGPDRAQMPASPYPVSLPPGSDPAPGIGEFFADYTGKVVTRLTGLSDLQLSPDGSTLYAAVTGADKIVAFDTGTLTQTAEYPRQRRDGAAPNRPHRGPDLVRLRRPVGVRPRRGRPDRRPGGRDPRPRRRPRLRRRADAVRRPGEPGHPGRRPGRP
jgi:hypothetical protein